jgi:hypothetical protein
VSTQQNSTQYQMQISAQQPSGSEYVFQQDLYAESDFGDTEAGAMLAATLATVPAAWSPNAQMTKIVNDATIYQWSDTAKAFQ